MNHQHTPDKQQILEKHDHESLIRTPRQAWSRGLIAAIAYSLFHLCITPGHMLLPIAALVVMLAQSVPVGYAAACTIGITVLVSCGGARKRAWAGVK